MAQGDSFELGVAVPLRNNHFNFGKYGKAQLYEGANPGDVWIKLSKSIGDGAQIPDLLQVGDMILLGPSSNSSNKKQSEHVRCSGVEDFTTCWKVHIHPKTLKYKYGAGDSVTFYAQGLAGAWNTLHPNVHSQGIKTGVIGLQTIAAFSYLAGGGVPGTNQYTLQGSAGRYKIVCKPSTYGYGINLIHPDFDYVISPMNADGTIEFAVKHAITDASIYVNLGDWHRGGWRKEFAQRLKIDFYTGMASGEILYQNLIDYGDPTQNIFNKASVIPYQFYRMGGKVFLENMSCTYDYGTQFTLEAVLKGNPYIRNLTEEVRVDIFGDTIENTGKWFSFSGMGLLQGGISDNYPPSFSVRLNNMIIGTPSYKGSMALYLDELWLEHAGGVNYADLDGCLKFSRYNVWPDQSTIGIDYEDRTTTGLYKAGKKIKLSCNIAYCPQDFWNQLETLLKWQDRGYSLNLHPNLDDIPYVLTGKIKISSIKKDNWDLSLRSFNLEFEEND
jgi:hypothetical protein